MIQKKLWIFAYHGRQPPCIQIYYSPATCWQYLGMRSSATRIHLELHVVHLPWRIDSGSHFSLTQIDLSESVRKNKALHKSQKMSIGLSSVFLRTFQYNATTKTCGYAEVSVRITWWFNQRWRQGRCKSTGAISRVEEGGACFAKVCSPKEKVFQTSNQLGRCGPHCTLFYSL